MLGAGFALALSFPAWADFTGKVVAGADGDTITVLRERKQVKVRLVEIDAPEKARAFGNRSKQSLSDVCFNKTAELDDNAKDRYGRTLARVYCDGVDANAQQVRRGMAWVYERYGRGVLRVRGLAIQRGNACACCCVEARIEGIFYTQEEWRR